MLALQVTGLVFACLGLLGLAANLRRLRPAQSFTLPDRAPRVSVLVPARNEERVIEGCVRSLLAQDYPDFEVVVLDDGSTDGTPAILEQLARHEARLRVIDGRPLPEGWLGKPWACSQLAEAADGEYLLFTDADTRHGVHSLAAGVANALAEGADMLAGLPHIEALTFSEQLVLPVVAWSSATLVPIELAYRVRWPWLSTANGQYMLFRRAAYEAIGGHAAVAAEVLEDLMLARAVKGAGMRWRLADVSDLVSTRMYRNAREILGGLGKTTFGVFDYGLGRFLLAGAILLVTFILPPAVMLAAALGSPLPGASVWLAVLTWLLATSQVAAGYSRFDYHPALALLYPVTMLAFTVVAVWSVVLTVAGRVSWKGREMPRRRLRWL